MSFPGIEFTLLTDVDAIGEDSLGTVTEYADAVAPLSATEPPTRTAIFAAMELRNAPRLSDTFPPSITQLCL